MSRLHSVALTALLLLSTAVCCRADINPQVVRQGKQATAMLEVGEVSGTAFCIDPAGIFVTAAHVVDDVGVGGRVSLILNPAEADQKKIIATVLRLDTDSDLAVLKTADQGPYTALTIGGVDKLYETLGVIAFGFPFGTDLALNPGDYPAVTVTTGRITALRRSKGLLQQIQMDATLNPGNSGGPITDEQGQVIGVADATIPGAALNFAVPSNLLSKLLTEPAIRFVPPTLFSSMVTTPQEFSVTVTPLTPSAEPLTVLLTLSTGPVDTRTYPMAAAGNNEYRVRAYPAVPTA